MRRATSEQRAERAQRVLLLGAEQAVALTAPQPRGERHRHPRPAVGARPGGRAERGLAVVPQPQRALQAAQPAPGALERAAVPLRGLQREHGHRRVVVAEQVAGDVAERRRPHEAESVAERDLAGVDHEPLDASEDDRQRAVAVGGRLELGVRGREARSVPREIGRLGPHRGEERLQPGVGLGAGIRSGHALAAVHEVAPELRERGEALGRRGVGRQAPEHADALGDEAAGQRLVAVQRRRRPGGWGGGRQLERDLGAAGDLLGELPGGLLHEGGQRVVQRAVVHAPPIRRGQRRSSRGRTNAVWIAAAAADGTAVRRRRRRRPARAPRRSRPARQATRCRRCASTR